MNSLCDVPNALINTIHFAFFPNHFHTHTHRFDIRYTHPFLCPNNSPLLLVSQRIFVALNGTIAPASAAKTGQAVFKGQGVCKMRITMKDNDAWDEDRTVGSIFTVVALGRIVARDVYATMPTERTNS